MTEPASSTAGGIAAWKIGSFILGIGVITAALGFLVLPPKTPKEYAVRSLATMIGSVLFGPLLVFGAYQQYPSIFISASSMAVSLGLEPWVGTLMAAAPLLAIAGIPVWWILGAWVLWMEKRKGRDLAELVEDARADIGKAIGGNTP